MKTITLSHVSKSLAQKTLFTDVNLSVALNDRVAIIGSNGAGKSTLLKIMAGLESIDEGTALLNPSVAYISQDFTADLTSTVPEYLQAMKATPQIHVILKKFAVMHPQLVETARLGELSGGQRRILEVAAVLSRGPMFLCIDEPENHLDIKARAVLTNLLSDYWGTVLFVSHDRHLINSIAKKIVLIEHEHVIVSTGRTYEQFMLERSEIHTLMQHDYAQEKRNVAALAATVSELRRQTQFSDSKAKTYQMKKRQLAERESALRTKIKPDDRRPAVKVVEVEQKQGKLIASMKNVEGGYGDTVLFSKTDLDIRFGQKICVLGRNGSGKTTLLRLITGEIKPLSGVVRLGINIKTTLFSQHSSINLEDTPFELMEAIGVTTDKARQLLTRLLFTRAEMEMVAKRLSGGQQQRLRLALLFYAQPDFVILDEPTNNLDPVNWQLLSELVNEFDGTVVCVTHDRSFIETLNEPQVLVLAKKACTRVWGSIDDAISLL